MSGVCVMACRQVRGSGDNSFYMCPYGCSAVNPSEASASFISAKVVLP